MMIKASNIVNDIKLAVMGFGIVFKKSHAISVFLFSLNYKLVRVLLTEVIKFLFLHALTMELL